MSKYLVSLGSFNWKSANKVLQKFKNSLNITIIKIEDSSVSLTAISDFQILVIVIVIVIDSVFSCIRDEITKKRFLKTYSYAVKVKLAEEKNHKK